MSYRGWDEQEVKEVRQALRQVSAIGQDDRRKFLSSFNPINYHTPFPSIDPLKTRHDRALDIDSIYDVPQDPVPEVLPQTKGRKRNSSAGNKGRVVSIGPVWEYKDDEDLPPEDHSIDHGPQMKKRKTAPSKRRNSAQLPSNIIPQLWEQEEAMVVTEPETYRENENLQLSPLTTPPTSENSLKKKAMASNCAPKLPPFKNPVITKPFAGPEWKRSPEEDLPRPRPVSNHPGWTTTQDAVKLSKTTLDKLAAFRYESSSASQPSKVFSDNPIASADHCQLVHVQQMQHPAPIALHGSIDYGFPSEGSIFHGTSTHRPSPTLHDHNAKHACEVMQRPHEPANDSGHCMELLMEHLPENSIYDTISSHGDMMLGVANVHYEEHELREGWTNLLKSTPVRPIQYVDNPDKEMNSHHCLQSKLSHALAEPPRKPPGKVSNADWQSSNYDEITSSEAKAIELTVITDHTIPGCGQSMEGFVQEKPNLTSVVDDALRALQEKENRAVLREDKDSHKRPQSPSDQFSQSEGLSSEQPLEGQVSRSDIEGVARHVSGNSQVDEFDQGLDDADLLAIASDQAVLETKVASPKDQGAAAHNQPKEPEPPNDSSKMLDEHSPRLYTSEIDEFLLDEVNEEKMLNLSSLKTGIAETFHPLASLNYGVEENPGSVEVYDSTLQFSLTKSRPSSFSPAKALEKIRPNQHCNDRDDSPGSTSMFEDVDESSIYSNDARVSQMTVRLPKRPHGTSEAHSSSPRLRRSSSAQTDNSLSRLSRSNQSSKSSSATSVAWVSYLDDSHLYEPLPPFARPDFPALIRDRSPIIGVSAQSFLRVCFRVGEMFKEGGRCNAMNQDAVIELFARVTFSSREPSTTKQHFQFADLWHDRPPFPSGFLANYKTTALIETESRLFVGAKEGIMARCFGRLKRDGKSSSGWMLHVISIRETDWEEIRWTRRIVSAGLVKSEK